MVRNVRGFIVRGFISLVCVLGLLFLRLFVPTVFAIVPSVATSTTTGSTQPSTMRHLVRTSEGTLHAFVQMGTNTTKCGSGGLWWLYSSDSGSNWTCGGQLSSDTSNLMYADARADTSDNIYVVYSVATTGGNAAYDVNYRKLTAANCSPAPCDWTMQSAQTVLDGDGSGDNAGFHYATIELQGTTRAWVAVREYDGTNYQVGVYYSDGLGNAPTLTESQATLDTAGTNAQYHYPTIVRFSTNIAVIWNDQVSGDLYWRYRADSDGLTTWNAAASFANRLTRFPTFSAIGDSTGNIYVSVQDSSVGFYHYLSSWSSVATVASPSVSDQFTSVSTDGTNVYVAYGDTTGITGGVNRKLAYKKGVPPFATGNFDTNATAFASYHGVFDKVWLYDASANTYEEETTDAGTTTTADIAHSSSGTIVKDTGDIIYMGKSTTFDAMSWVPSTVSTGGTNSWQYCSAVDSTPTCTTWTPITFTVQQNQGWKGSGYGAFTVPSDWQASKVNGEGTAYYYVRDETTSSYTVGPVGTQLTTIPLPSWPSLAASTNGVYALWTENASSPMNVRYTTILSFNSNPNAPTSLGGHVTGAFTLDTTPTFTFTLSDADAADTVKYKIQIDDSSDFGSAVVDYTSALAAQGSTSFTVGQAAGSGSYTTGASGQTLSDGSYYWRVKTIDDDAAESSYSTANSGSVALQVDATAPSVPGTPTTGSAATDTTPTWSWSASTDAGAGLSSTPYTLQWSQSSDFTSGVSSTTATTNSFTHSATLADGTWYFRVKASDDVGNESGYSTAGSTTIDATAPAAFDLESPGNNGYTNAERPTFTWRGTSDATVGLSKYVLEIDNPQVGSGQPSGDFIIDNIPTSRTWDYETDRYVIHYENFADSDANNNYISVRTKSSNDWATDQNNGALQEGKVTWKVKAVDSAGNQAAVSRTLFVDKTSPNATFTQINETPYSTQIFSTTDTTPTIFGKLTDPLSGGDTFQTQGDYGPKIASGPKQVDIKVEKQTGSGYTLVTLYTINVNTIWFACNGQEVIDTSKQICDKYVPFAYTSKEQLSLGIYKITLTGKDAVGHVSSETTLALHVTTLAQIVTPEEIEVIEEQTKSLTPEQKERVNTELEITRPIEPRPLENVQTRVFQAYKNIVNTSGNFLASIGNTIGQAIGKAFAFVRDTSAQGLSSIGKAAGNLFASLLHGAGSATAYVRLGFENAFKAVGGGLVWTGEAATKVQRAIPFFQNVNSMIGRTVGNIVIGAFSSIQGIDKSLSEARSSAITGIFTSSRNMGSTIARSGKLAVDGVKEGIANTTFSIGEQVQNVSDTVGIAIMQFGSRFVTTPTIITNVRVAVINPTSAKVSWETNHPANGKVNYGLDRTYPFDVQSEKRVTQHEFTLTDLAPDTVYHFEVMSHNNNYVYDANREFRTPPAK